MPKVDLEAALAKAKLPADDAKRLKKLVAFVKTQAKVQPDRVPVVANGVLYIAGLAPKPPKRSQHFKYMEELLLPALHQGNALTDWDKRVFEIWATGGTGLMELSLWVLTQAQKYPDDDVMQRFVELAPGIDVKNDEFYRYLPGAAHDAKGKVTSIGRWLASRGTKLANPEVMNDVMDDVDDAPERDVSKGYALDVYTATLVKTFLGDIKNTASPITELSIYVSQTRTLPELVLVRTNKELQYGVCEPTTPALEAIAADEDDLVLAKINEDLDEELSWGDYGELPAAILNYELVRAAHAIADKLRAKKMLAEGAKVGLLIDDEHFATADRFGNAAKTRLKKLPKAARIALVAACYANKNAGSWLS